ncbi:hypothetical protein TVAG_146050 [Trichomonas vaginalis G3]|uniref:DUF3447 domain-containing protein n=1 Tax=Trichomonas vaginalis (strain ATCC PRA-98 / G3) TaxID=412133 RepID=A2F8A8_TRIV3|nr:protein ubiquitination [Trichomonas vaginalis G3]EAX98868.1 hypothetical protein TVAG_146050 [Trichomonas vaginalis G3]KAI5540554.1 protein ubiquitination [Trichomonas vaginalis G3]|eukprot:XP_001311798.1 hypothetical protein [Trichomonas vaginalis G3]
MSDQDINTNKYFELRSVYACYIDSYNALYQLKTNYVEDLDSIYKMIKTNLIDSNKYPPSKLIRNILNIITYNNRYAKSYLALAKLISDDCQVNEATCINTISNYLFYKQFGIKLDKYNDFENIKLENLEIHSENTIYKAIMYNDLERFIQFTESEIFNKYQYLKSSLYQASSHGYSLLDLCCYHGAVDCFIIVII